ncbi:D-alanyl-D-alanine carboxypeptidase family protein [Myceligenerans sp. TRM 65318]|uniref:D-alanyl-D-alanine carboxypeptidase family protein n=1 Tax=Myceligenerans pegani TaxID=2776917 RepID=A0ABR9MTI2_9MICO|nr:D-alanyl-D-alanine carboxypeptidase family protein [Myceligenerans sp. TRM 65318]MBE3016954.1 D-alanyl-D-alanine carboxypeptidase family protein [Myceligenerans sp. TRM 65318]
MKHLRSLLSAGGVTVVLLGVASCAPVVSHGPAADAGTAPARQSGSPSVRIDVGRASPAPSPSPSESSSFDLSRHSVTDPASPWVVVNKRRPLERDDVPRLTVVRGYLVRPEIARDLESMLGAAHHDGVDLTLRSAYRSWGKQAAVYDGWVASLGRDRADEISARPGHSEHQTGLAVDVGSSTRPGCDFEPCLADTEEGRWVARHAGEFGFLVRYTAANQDVTGYGPEPWHLRWVGRGLAAHMAATGIDSLEEVFDVPGGDYPARLAPSTRGGPTARYTRRATIIELMTSPAGCFTSSTSNPAIVAVSISGYSSARSPWALRASRSAPGRIRSASERRSAALAVVVVPTSAARTTTSYSCRGTRTASSCTTTVPGSRVAARNPRAAATAAGSRSTATVRAPRPRAYPVAVSGSGPQPRTTTERGARRSR